MSTNATCSPDECVAYTSTYPLIRGDANIEATLNWIAWPIYQETDDYYPHPFGFGSCCRLDRELVDIELEFDSCDMEMTDEEFKQAKADALHMAWKEID